MSRLLGPAAPASRRAPDRLVMADDVVRHLVDLCRRATGTETGGILFGRGPRWLDRRALARYASGPGPRAEATAGGLEWDGSYQIGFLEAVAASCALRSEVLGRWHKHPSGSVEPSATDVASAADFRQRLGLDHCVDVIVACQDDEPVGWATFVSSEAGYHRIS